MKHKAKILWLFLILVSTGGASYFIWHVYFSNTAKVMTQVKNALSDPESAKFQNVEFFPQTGAGCGLVNVKNKMGGYVGSTRFIVLANGGVRLEPLDATDSGPIERQLAGVNKKIDFLKLHIANCPEKKPN